MVTRLDLAPDLVIWQGDVRDALREIPDNTVQCVVTSPPYFGLRDYGTGQWEGGDPNCDHRPDSTPTRRGIASSTLGGGKRTTGHQQEGYRSICPRCGARRVDKQIGLEATVKEYVQTLVEVFREVRRVLRPDGTLWLNLGDSYNGSGGAGGHYGPGGLREGQPRYPGRRLGGLKPKDLIGVPWRVAFALQADGWYLRSDIIWAKPNPMPESVTDRPTKAHEYIFLLTKAERYFYDADAIREPSTWDPSKTKFPDGWDTGKGGHGSFHRQGREKGRKNDASNSPAAMHGRNKRSVWTVPTRPFPEAHFAVYPPDLIEPCILAGTSPYACPHCGAPWRRVVERYAKNHRSRIDRQIATGGAIRRGVGKNFPDVARYELGWQPTCSCEGNDGSGKCIVLDPFWGSGTTGLVALQHGRIAWGIELNPAYVEISKRRLLGMQTTLLGRV